MTKRRPSIFGTALEQEIAFLKENRLVQAVLFVVLPLVVVVMCAMFNRGVTQEVPVAVVDHDHSAMSRRILSNIDAAREVSMVASVPTNQQAQHLMRTNKVYAYIEIPRGAEGALIRGDDRVMAIRYNTQWRSAGSVAYLGLQNAVSDATQSVTQSLLRGHPGGAAAAAPFNPQITSISNAQSSFERFLVPIAVPVVTFIALGAVVVRAYGRLLFAGPVRAYWRKLNALQWFMDAIGRVTPYSLVALAILLLFWVWLVHIRGWPIAGSPWLFTLALAVMCYATGCIAVMLILLTRSTAAALGMTTLYASAALSYASATLSLDHAGWWARFWSGLQPFTHYYKIQIEQVNLGSDPMVSLQKVGLLLLYIVIPLILARLLFVKTLDKPLPPAETGEIHFSGFKGGFSATIKDVIAVKSIKSTALASLVMFSMFYPAAYSSQVNEFIPVAIVDLDHSSLSERFIENLKSTRVVEVVEEPQRTNEAMEMLRNHEVLAAITIDNNFKYDVERGGQGGVLAQMNAGYMSMSSNLQSGIVSALMATREANSPNSASSGSNIVGMPLFNETDGYETYVMPLVFVLIIQQTTMFGTAMLTAVRRGEGLRSLDTSQFFGNLAGMATISFFGCCFIFGLVFWWLTYPLLGNLLVLVGLAAMFATAIVAAGMLAGSFLDRIYQASMLLGPTSMLTFYASGGAFAKFNMPDIINDLFLIFPSTTMINGFSILNSQGATPHEMIPTACKLGLLTLILISLAWWRLVKHPSSHSIEGASALPIVRGSSGVSTDPGE